VSFVFLFSNYVLLFVFLLVFFFFVFVFIIVIYNIIYIIYSLFRERDVFNETLTYNVKYQVDQGFYYHHINFKCQHRSLSNIMD
jgi:hypothetical protein